MMPHHEIGVRIAAVRNAERSISHWGVFPVPAGAVTIRMFDLGQVEDEVVSLFILDGRAVKSRFPFDRDLAVIRGARLLAQDRIDADTACICSEWDLDPSSIKVLN